MTKRDGFRVGPRAVCLAVWAVVGVPAWAATDTDALRRQSEILQRQQQDQIKRDQEAAMPAEKAPSGIDTRDLVPKVDASKAAGQCRVITDIVVTGAPHLSGAMRLQLNKQFATGQCLGVPEIEQVLGEITRDYVLRGYVTTRVYLPAQDLSKGKLEIMVVEGVIEKIRIEDGGRKSISPGNTLPSKPGDVLNLRDLEQGIDQINRLQSNKATLDIQPGSLTGASEVVIRNEPDRLYHWLFSYDNQGSAATRADQLGATLSLDNLVGFNEFVSLTHREGVPGYKDRRYSASDSVYAALPYGYNTFSFSGSESRYMSAMNMSSGTVLHTGGVSSQDTFKWDRVVFRNQATRASLGTSYTLKDTKSYLEDQLLTVSSRKLSVLDVDSNVTTSLGDGFVSFDLGYAEGLRGGGALRDMEDLPASSPRAQFKKFKYGASYTLPFRWVDKDWTFMSQLTGQQSRSTLYGSEQIAIGSIYSVRGFVTSTLAGDSGYYVRNELAVRQMVMAGGEALPLRLFVGLDVGAVHNRAPDVPQGSMVGAALGGSIGWRGATLEVFSTSPVALPKTLERESCQTWVRLSYAI